MHYVKSFKINGVDTAQIPCIELQGKPNSATEGRVGVLGIDMVSPLHDVYKCVAVNGSIYTWELLSSGLSIMSASISGEGDVSMEFPYEKIRKPSTYIIKPGDLILDREGYLYQVDSLKAESCVASYCGTRVVAYGMSAYDLAVYEGFEGSLEEWFTTMKGEKGDPGLSPHIGDNGNWWIGDIDTGAIAGNSRVATGSYKGTGKSGTSYPNVLEFDFAPKLVIVTTPTTDSSSAYPYIYIMHGGVSLLIGGDPSVVTTNPNCTFSGNKVEWSHTNALLQMNYSIYTYTYIAIG